MLTSVFINCKQSHVSLSVLPCLFAICVCFTGGLIRQVYVICCNLAAVIQLTSHLCCSLISAQAFRSWQTKHMPQFCFWERLPGSSVETVSFIISIGDSLNSCSAVFSGALMHTFAFIVCLYHSFISVTKLHKLVLLFFFAGFLHFYIFISSSLLVNGEFLLFSFSTFLQNILQKSFSTTSHPNASTNVYSPLPWLDTEKRAKLLHVWKSCQHANRNIASIWTVISNFEQVLVPNGHMSI